jgi:hypothetical protein
MDLFVEPLPMQLQGLSFPFLNTFSHKFKQFLRDLFKTVLPNSIDLTPFIGTIQT